MLRELIEFFNISGDLVDRDYTYAPGYGHDKWQKLRQRLMTLINNQPFPKIVCLCGSRRFITLFHAVNSQETLAGNIVLSIGDCSIDGEDKIRTDKLHFRKIELADEVIIISVDKYIGESTRNEIEYAESLGKPIRCYDLNSKTGVLNA